MTATMKQVLILALLSVCLFGQERIFEKSSNLLPHTKMLLNHEKNIDSLLHVQNRFTPVENTYINLGYTDQTLWLDFSITNNQNQPITKSIVIDNNILDHVILYRMEENGSITQHRSGLLNRTRFDSTLYFSFEESFPPHSSTRFLLRIASRSCPVHFGLYLMDAQTLQSADKAHQFKLLLFFGALGAILILNLIFYLFTRDSSFLFYAFYLFALILENMVYRGLSIYFFTTDGVIDLDLVRREMQLGSLVVTLLALSIVLFTKSFLKTALYPKINLFLNTVAAFYIISILLYFTGLSYDLILQFTMLLSFIFPIFIWFIGLYALVKKNRFGLYFVIGWGIVISAIYMKVVFNLGLASEPMIHYPYFYEALLILEALFFSFALANKINLLKEEKEKLHLSLIQQQKSEPARLQKLVDEQTYDLQKSLQKEQILLKELNHRVKNNMQTIISIYRLKLRNFLDSSARSKADDAENAVLAMSKVHTMLYSQEGHEGFDTQKYIQELGDELSRGFSGEKITITYDIQTEISIANIIYCGILLNELITNSAKHAFKGKKGEITIQIHKEGDMTCIRYRDSGEPPIPSQKERDSFGLKLIDIIIKEQLQGMIKTSSEGTFHICFKDKPA